MCIRHLVITSNCVYEGIQQSGWRSNMTMQTDPFSTAKILTKVITFNLWNLLCVVVTYIFDWSDTQTLAWWNFNVFTGSSHKVADYYCSSVLACCVLIRKVYFCICISMQCEPYNSPCDTKKKHTYNKYFISPWKIDNILHLEQQFLSIIFLYFHYFSI